MQFADNAGPDQGLLCPLIELMGIVVYVNEQRISRSDCTIYIYSNFDFRYVRLCDLDIFREK